MASAACSLSIGSSAKPADETATKTGNRVRTGLTPRRTEDVSIKSELGRYWLEVLPPGLIAEPKRVAGPVPLKSGQAFKFHFDFEQDGYLYIVGPGEGNQPTAFLTNQPATISGLEDNQVTKGADFSFPDGIEHWMELDKKAGTENYTIIFSKQKLTSPAFFNSQATGKPLEESEQAELKISWRRTKRQNPLQS